MKVNCIFSLFVVSYAALVIAITGYFLPPQTATADELGSQMMFDIWKHRTGEADTGLLTGRASKPKSAEPPMISAYIRGNIYFNKQQGVLLPEDELEIKLLNVSRQDAPAAVIATQSITAQRQVPVTFKISYDPAHINPAHRYAVQARFLRKGRECFINTTPCYVITHGHTNNVNIFLE
jgi:putative lipoprotein